MNIDDYTQGEQAQLRAISAMHESVRKLGILAISLDPEARPTIQGNIAALKQSIEAEERHMARVVKNRKIKISV